MDDFYQHPLIQDGANYFVMLDRAMCAPAFIEAVVFAMKPVFKGNRRHLFGKGVEHLLQTRFAARGMQIRAGKYKSHNVERDCDLVIETDQTIFFIEAKSKALTVKARAGSEVHVILDFAWSALKAQAQAGWHELNLRRHGYLMLKDDNGHFYRLELKGRDVERVAVSLHDYGSFQDRSSLMGFLDSHIGASYSVNLPKFQDDFDDLNDILREIEVQEKELAQHRPEKYSQFANCWFLSLPQMLIVLDDATDAESFRKTLFEIRSVTMGTLDFYREYANWKRMKAAAAAEAATMIDNIA